MRKGEVNAAIGRDCQIGLAAPSPGGRKQFAHLRKTRRRKQPQAGKDAH
jgi:hypothetical protein